MMNNEAAAMCGGDLNLKMEAVAIGGCERGLTMMEEEVASEGVDTLKTNLVGLSAMKSTAEAQSVGAWKKKNQAVASESEAANELDLRSNEASRPWEEEGGILRLKKETYEAWRRWHRVHASSRKARKQEIERVKMALLGTTTIPREKAQHDTTQEKPQGTTQEKEAEAPGAGKKKKVVKKILPKEYVDHMAAYPLVVCPDQSDEHIAQYPPYYREIYDAGKFLQAKSADYWDVLIDQQKKIGYAEDEIEVTDDEEDLKN